MYLMWAMVLLWLQIEVLASGCLEFLRVLVKLPTPARLRAVDIFIIRPIVVTIAAFFNKCCLLLRLSSFVCIWFMINLLDRASWMVRFIVA